jgi:hypothetical protein
VFAGDRDAAVAVGGLDRLVEALADAATDLLDEGVGGRHRPAPTSSEDRGQSTVSSAIDLGLRSRRGGFGIGPIGEAVGDAGAGYPSR